MRDEHQSAAVDLTCSGMCTSPSIRLMNDPLDRANKKRGMNLLEPIEGEERNISFYPHFPLFARTELAWHKAFRGAALTTITEQFHQNRFEHDPLEECCLKAICGCLDKEQRQRRQYHQGRLPLLASETGNQAFLRGSSDLWGGGSDTLLCFLEGMAFHSDARTSGGKTGAKRLNAFRFGSTPLDKNALVG